MVSKGMVTMVSLSPVEDLVGWSSSCMVSILVTWVALSCSSDVGHWFSL